jgi:outer membrane lipoprotein carrier protein
MVNVLKRFLLGSFPVVLAISASAFAAKPTEADPYARLDEFMRGLQSLQAEFRQSVHDAQGRKVEESRGELALSRPNRFRWDYREPHPQVIVADGKNLWLYDPDLEQVTVRRLDRSLAGTPAMLLSGEGDLRASFKIENAEQKSGTYWLTLSPKRTDTDFKRVKLGMRGTTLAAMELVDKLGQVTVLEFSSVSRNPTFEDSRFVFNPPAGVDVIGEKTE